VPQEGTSSPLPVNRIPADLCRRLEWFFTDIDDTLTEGGILPARSFQALWDLCRAGLRVVPVTGRPAGWCDHIARMWPVHAVVGENGAFTYAYDRERRLMRRRYSVPPAELERGRRRLAEIAERIVREVPGAGVAADQPFRISDYAIDFREDVPPLAAEAVDRICGILAAVGVRYKVSSIHVNYWLGGFDKLSCLDAFLAREAGLPLSRLQDRVTFIGDSPNDEPLFHGVSHSIAVGNLREFVPRLTHLPRYITRGDSAAGFCEAVEAILAKRGPSVG
jgi:HAD superfamily hydrolase (TIGR01484 family)